MKSLKIDVNNLSTIHMCKLKCIRSFMTALFIKPMNDVIYVHKKDKKMYFIECLLFMFQLSKNVNNSSSWCYNRECYSKGGNYVA